MSLAQLALVVNKKGWRHGVEAIAADVLRFHSEKRVSSSAASSATYATAAIRAIQNSQKLSKNMSIILEESAMNTHVSNVANFALGMVGRGWLWDKESDIGGKTSFSDEELCSAKDEPGSAPIPTHDGLLTTATALNRTEETDADEDEVAQVLDLISRALENRLITDVSCHA